MESHLQCAKDMRRRGGGGGAKEETERDAGVVREREAELFHHFN